MKNELKILIIAFLSMFVYGMVLQSIPPILVVLIKELSLSHTQGGLLMSLFALPGILVSIPGGVLADFYGPQKVGIASLLLMLAGTLLVGTGSSFAGLAMGRLLAGIGGTVIVIVAAQAISQGFLNNKRFGIAMGIFNAGVPSGTIFAHNFFSRAVIVWGWHVPVFFSAFCCLIMLLLYWRFTGFVTVSSEEKQGIIHLSGRSLFFPESLRNFKAQMGIWLVGFSWLIYMAAKTGAITFAPDYFLSIGYMYSYAGFLASLFTMGSLVISPLTGHFIGKTGKEENYILVGCIAMAILFILIYTASTGHVFLAALNGATAAFIPVSVFSLVPRLVQAKKLGLGYGILRICENTGILVGPFVGGLVYDLSGGSYLYAFLVFSVFCLSSAAGALLLRLLRKKNRNVNHTL